SVVASRRRLFRSNWIYQCTGSMIHPGEDILARPSCLLQDQLAVMGHLIDSKSPHPTCTSRVIDSCAAPPLIIPLRTTDGARRGSTSGSRRKETIGSWSGFIISRGGASAAYVARPVSEPSTRITPLLSSP